MPRVFSAVLAMSKPFSPWKPGDAYSGPGDTEDWAEGLQYRCRAQHSPPEVSILVQS